MCGRLILRGGWRMVDREVHQRDVRQAVIGEILPDIGIRSRAMAGGAGRSPGHGGHWLWAAVSSGWRKTCSAFRKVW